MGIPTAGLPGTTYKICSSARAEFKFQILVEVGLRKAGLGREAAIAGFDVVQYWVLVLFGVFVDVSEVALIHHLADRVLLGVDVLDFELAVGHDY